MTLLNDPFFWAFVSMFALVGASQVVSGCPLGKYPLFGFIIVAIFELGRVVLALPALPQPRFETGGWHWFLGAAVFAIGMIFSIPALTIRPFTAPNQKVKLNTTGFYNIVRNPIYLGEVLWCLGWSIMFRSITGVVLVPFWWAGLLSHTMIEEQSLERELGQLYLEYKRRVSDCVESQGAKVAHKVHRLRDFGKYPACGLVDNRLAFQTAAGHGGLQAV